MNTFEKLEKTLIFIIFTVFIWFFFNKFAVYVAKKFFQRTKPEVLETSFWTFAQIFFKIFSIITIIMSLFVIIRFWI